MSRFAIRTPYLIIVVCLMIAILGGVSVYQMPVDMFPAMNVPVVIVATFYSGMPPEQVEGNITYHLERFFTLASGIDHMESRSLDGVSIIRVYFQPDTNAGQRLATRLNFRDSFFQRQDFLRGVLFGFVMRNFGKIWLVANGCLDCAAFPDRHVLLQAIHEFAKQGNGFRAMP